MIRPQPQNSSLLVLWIRDDLVSLSLEHFVADLIVVAKVLLRRFQLVRRWVEKSCEEVLVLLVRVAANVELLGQLEQQCVGHELVAEAPVCLKRKTRAFDDSFLSRVFCV